MSLFRNTANLIGKPYKLGGFGINSFDCFNVVVAYLRNVGIDIKESETFKNFTFENYCEKYKKNPSVAIEIAAEYLKTKVKEIAPHQVAAGDIVFTECRGHKSIGIDVGNGFILGATEKHGVIQLPKEHYKILRAFKCHK